MISEYLVSTNTNIHVLIFCDDILKTQSPGEPLTRSARTVDAAILDYFGQHR